MGRRFEPYRGYMAKVYTTGKGKFGLKIVHTDGDTEYAYYTTPSERDKVYRNMQSVATSVDKLAKKR